MPFVRRSPMPVPAAELAAWHFRPGAFERLAPPWDRVELRGTTGPLADGSRWTIRTPLVGPFAMNYVAELFDVRPGAQFRDRQLRGPFAAWQHTHRFLPDGANSVLEDDIDYRLPLGALGRLLGGRTVRSTLERMFAYRHEVTRRDLARHAGPPLTFAITGSRGLVGRELVAFLTAGGHRVIRLVRDDEPPPYDDGTSRVPWEPAAGLNPKLLEGVQAVVHLASEPIAAGRWTASKKARIRDSRTGPTRRLAEAAKAAGVRTFLSASAVGVYGDRGAEELPEGAASGTGFLADVCRDWEAAARVEGPRVALLRIGVVLTPKGAALGRQLLPFRLGLGAVLGRGTQFVPWVSIDDLLAAILHVARTESLAGPVNVVAPHPVPNREFGRTLARVLRAPFLFTAPSFALQALFGEVVHEALLSSMRVVPAKLLASGFRFEGPHLEPELRYLLGRAG